MGMKRALLLRRYAKIVYVVYDGDAPGRKAARKTVAELRGMVPAVVIDLPAGKDPASMTHQERKSVFSRIYR